MNITISTIDDTASMPAPPSPPPRSCHARQRQKYISVYVPCVFAGALIIYGQVQGCNEITRQFVTGLALATGGLGGFISLKLADKLL